MFDEPAEPQTPAGDQIFLDHVGWFVPDMDAAAESFSRLGFPMSPYTVHTNEQPDGSRVPSGTANRCAMIARGYLEVLTAVPDTDTALSRQLRAGLDRYTGLHLIAFTVGDAEAATARLRDACFDPDPPVALRRPMPLDGGGEGTAAFSVIRLPPGTMVEGRVQMLTQETPDVVWQPSVTAKENALDMLSSILICTDDVDETVGRYERFTGRAAESRDGLVTIALDRGELAICDPATCSAILPGCAIPSLPFLAAVAIRSADLDATRTWMSSVRLIADDGDRIIVHPDDGMGAAFVLHRRGAAPFASS
jgi:hypothetical protein